MEGGSNGPGANIYAHWRLRVRISRGVLIHICAYWRLRVRIPLRTCDFCCWLLVLWGASRSARKKASCARPHWRKLRVLGLAAGRLFLISPRFSPMRVLRFIVLGATAGVKNEFRPRCTGGGAERSSKPEMPVLASQALATDPFPRFFRVRRARKLHLVGPKCASAATQVSPTRLKPPKMTFLSPFRHSAFFLARMSLCQAAIIGLKPRLRPKGGCRMPLRTRVASRPNFLGLETGTYGHQSVRAGALDAQIGAQNPQLVGSQASRPL